MPTMAWTMTYERRLRLLQRLLGNNLSHHITIRTTTSTSSTAAATTAMPAGKVLVHLLVIVVGMLCMM